MHLVWRGCSEALKLPAAAGSSPRRRRFGYSPKWTNFTVATVQVTEAGMTDEIRVGQVAVRFLVEGEASGGSVAMFEFDVPAGAKVPIAHSHDGYEETIYGLSGILTWTMDGQKRDVGPGQVLCIPRGAVHRFDNTRSDDATMLAVVTPGILGP